MKQSSTLNSSKRTSVKTQLPKTPTGIKGLDEITHGGLPTGRPTLICGDAGSGKTLLSVEFIVRGILEYDQPGVFFAFEERKEELATNVASLGFDLELLQKQKKIRVEYVHVDKTEIEETGEYDLEGLFIRLNHAIDSIGATRVVLDTIENLFAGLTNQGILRAEIRRLFSWLKSKGVTAIITGERGDKTLTRQGLEEYVSDCVILLDHRIINQISTRRLRIIKYRGTVHGTNEYPFLIDEDGISVMPITTLTLDNAVSTQRVSSGVPTLDEMLGGKGFYRGSSVLVSGTAGTGKTSLGASFVDASCARGERAMIFTFEESSAQYIRNMRSIGLDLQRHVDDGLLEFSPSRPTMYGLEMHLVVMYKRIRSFKPKVVVFDPISNLVTVGNQPEVLSLLFRLIDFLQEQGITTLFTSLWNNNLATKNEEPISSIMDTWILIRDIEMNGERNLGLFVIKSRGIKHSNQVREFVITNDGLKLIDVYQGPDGVLTGSARESQMMAETTGKLIQKSAIGRKERDLARKRSVLESRILALKSEFEIAEEEMNKNDVEEEIRKRAAEENRTRIIDKRMGKKSKNISK